MPAICSKCKIKRSVKEFGPSDRERLANGQTSGWCRPCKRTYQNAYAKKRKGEPAYEAKQKEAQRHSRVSWYGITQDDFQEISDLQGGACAGCGYVPPPGAKNLNIDHEHQEGDKKLAPFERALYVRGLLCYICNRVLGLLRDNPETLKNLAAYLESPPATQVVYPKLRKIFEYVVEGRPENYPPQIVALLEKSKS